jgi:hypothetical protein
MYQPQFWVLRQNPCANTNQEQMRNFIITQQFITCPFGHISDARNNVLNGRYNETDPEWKSNSQDRKFIENMKIGDKCIIPFKGINECLIVEIISEPMVQWTGLFTIQRDGEEIQLANEGEIPFHPVGRQIRILNYNKIFTDKRVLPRASLAHTNEIHFR